MDAVKKNGLFNNVLFEFYLKFCDFSLFCCLCFFYYEHKYDINTDFQLKN